MIKEITIDNLMLINNIQSIFNEFYTQKKKLIDEFRYNKFTRMFAYIEEDKVVGILQISDIIDRYEIVYIAVDEAYRNQGIATSLIKHIVELGKNSNIINITLEVCVTNINAIKLYEKNLFKKVAVRKNYYNGIDGILMERKMI